MKLHRIATAGLVMGVLLFAHVSRGDFWGPPTTKFRSSNRQYLLEVGWPREKTLTLFKVTPKGDKVKLWTRSYVDETWPPHAAYVANNGQYVVLRDVYSRLGSGKVLAFLGPKGELLRAFELADLLTEDQISSCTQTISSLWWSEPGWFSLINGDRHFAFATHFGEVQCFDVNNGRRVTLDAKRLAEIRARALRDILPCLKSKDSTEKKYAATLCGALKATEAIPELKNLLRDNTPTSGIYRGLSGAFAGMFGGMNYSDVQVAAAKSLVAMLKIEAVPLIEEQLPKATPETRKELLDVIAGLDGNWFMATKPPDSAVLLATWHRLSQSPLPDVRKHAREAILDRDDAKYVRNHPELIKDSDENVRWRAAMCLGRNGDKRAIPLLRTAFHDESSTVQLWALRGLIEYKPDDIDAILREARKCKDDWVRVEARDELVRRGDKEAIADLLRQIAALKDEKLYAKASSIDQFHLDRLCRLIIETKLREAEPSLRQAYSNPCDAIHRPISATLAAFGDLEARQQLRQYAQKGRAFDRVCSIEMLALIGDKASIPALQESLNDKDASVQRAAKKAIARLK